MWKQLVLVTICNTALIASTIKPIHKENGIWFPGKGCGIVNEIKYLQKMPEDISNLDCTFIFADMNQKGLIDHVRIPKDPLNIGSVKDDSSETSPTGTRVMLVGGTVSGANKNDIEIIDLEDSSYTCPKSDNKDLKIFPDHNVHSPGGGLVRYGDGYMPFICGGETNSKGKSDLCYQLPSGETEFKLDETAKMNTKRRSVAHSVLDDKLVIAGGDKGGRTDTIEVMKPNEAAVELNAKLPVKVQDFCAVPISDSGKIWISITIYKCH